MKKVLLAALALIIAFPVFADDDKPITIDKMPAAAQDFIKTHFDGLSVAVAKQEGAFIIKNYEVIFSNGDKVEFNRNGVWTNVDCKYSSVPQAIVPDRIAKYVAEKFPGAQILQIEKEDRRYEVELSNNIDLKFNNSFEILDVDF